MKIDDFKNKVILFAYPDEQIAIAGIVVDVVGKDILYLQAIPEESANVQTSSYYFISLEYLACNPDVVQIFDSKEAFDKFSAEQKERHETKKDDEKKVLSFVKKKKDD